MSDIIPISSAARFRRFARAVTTEVGALDESFLGRGRPLGAARVLNAVANGHNGVGSLRAFLGLDSGLASRLLRGLEAESLIETFADSADARRRLIRLTPAGEREAAIYDRLSDARADRLIRNVPDPEALLQAMDLVATALGRERITLELSDPRSRAAKTCLEAYYRELAERFEGGFDVARSLNPDAESMMAPRGAFIMANSDGMPVGCVGLKGTSHGYAEIKRLWVAPVARGLGLATQLMEAAEEQARTLGIAVLRLDTNRALPEASQLYRRRGWREIDRFNDDPYAHLFFEKRLD